MKEEGETEVSKERRQRGEQTDGREQKRKSKEESNHPKVC